MRTHKDISTYIFNHRNRQENKRTYKITPFCISNLSMRYLFSLLWMRRWSTVQTQLKLSSIPVSRSMQGPSSQIHIYPFLYVSPPLLTPACLASHSTIDHHSPTGHGRGGGWSGRGGRGDEAGWLAETVWNYHRPTSASWKYHQNLWRFRMHGWVPAVALQSVARVFQFYLYSLHFCLKTL